MLIVCKYLIFFNYIQYHIVEVSIYIDGFTAYIYDREFFMILLNDKKDIYR